MKSGSRNSLESVNVVDCEMRSVTFQGDNSKATLDRVTQPSHILAGQHYLHTTLYKSPFTIGYNTGNSQARVSKKSSFLGVAAYSLILPSEK